MKSLKSRIVVGFVVGLMGAALGAVAAIGHPGTGAGTCTGPTGTTKVGDPDGKGHHLRPADHPGWGHPGQGGDDQGDGSGWDGCGSTTGTATTPSGCQGDQTADPDSQGDQSSDDHTGRKHRGHGGDDDDQGCGSTVTIPTSTVPTSTTPGSSHHPPKHHRHRHHASQHHAHRLHAKRHASARH